jgi:galactonate dehydratase
MRSWRDESRSSRRGFLTNAIRSVGRRPGFRRSAASPAAGPTSTSTAGRRRSSSREGAASVTPGEGLRITRLETFLVKPRWLFLKVYTDEGITGLGEPILEGRALTCQQAVEEIEPYLIGKDPRLIAHHWQAIYRHAFYRGGPILTSALSGVEQALWDIKGKALQVPVHQLLGGPTRDRVRVYAHVRSPDDLKLRSRKASRPSRPE